MKKSNNLSFVLLIFKIPKYRALQMLTATHTYVFSKGMLSDLVSLFSVSG